jgi:hypothetical protein
MDNFGYKKSVFAYISNCKLTLGIKCPHTKKIAPEFLVIQDFSKMH